MSQSFARKRRRLDCANQAGPAVVNEGVLQEENPEFDDPSVDAQPGSACGIELLSDTMSAIMLLRSHYSASAQTAALVLKSQIYTIVKDRTIVDQDLERHRQAGIIRMIKLPASVDDYGYILHDDYLAGIDAAQQAAKERGTKDADLKIFLRFKQLVINHCKEASIVHSDLMALLSKPRRSQSRELDASSTVTDRQISLLMGAGLLTRQVGGQASYLFAVAGAGKLVTSITKGRKEVLAALSRKRYKEASLKDMKKVKLSSSVLDVQWHLRDLTGRGSVTEIDTPSGPFIRLVRKES